MFVVSLSLLYFCELYNFGAHPLAMDAHSGNARGGIQMRLTHPPRSRASQLAEGGEGCERDSLNLKIYLEIPQAFLLL